MAEKEQPFPMSSRTEVKGLGFRAKVNKRKPQGQHRIL
jgi:hypothetical protein